MFTAAAEAVTAVNAEGPRFRTFLSTVQTPAACNYPNYSVKGRSTERYIYTINAEGWEIVGSHRKADGMGAKEMKVFK